MVNENGKGGIHKLSSYALTRFHVLTHLKYSLKGRVKGRFRNRIQSSRNLVEKKDMRVPQNGAVKWDGQRERGTEGGRAE